MGLAAVASHALPDASVGNSVILLIGMAVGVDYSLFYLKREREERARAGGRVSPSAVVEFASATSGRAIVVSGLAVIVSTACLYLATDVIFSSLATGTIIAVLVAMVSSLTVLPAILAKAGDRVDHRRARRAVRPASERQGTGRADEIRAAGGHVDHQELDVTNLDSVRAFTETAHDRLGRIDVLVNNAGSCRCRGSTRCASTSGTR
jgi:uncharacterized membrane protein YdfJ with MMPL/SSD domain